MPQESAVKLDYETYSSERKDLYKYQQTAYDNYEKTLTALASSALAFSIGFVGYLQSSAAKGQAAISNGSQPFLYATWAALFLSILCLISCFFVNVKAFTLEMHLLDMALEDTRAFDRSNVWTTVSMWLYAASAILFFAGLSSQLLFCYRNFLQ